LAERIGTSVKGHDQTSQFPRKVFAVFVLAVACPPRTTVGTRCARVQSFYPFTACVEADKDPGNWLMYARTYSEQRFSPLAQISADNIKQLGLAWYADLDSVRGQEATPLVIDGVMYVSVACQVAAKN
jgi:glucose dehydrogenase